MTFSFSKRVSENEMADITANIEEIVAGTGKEDGVCTVEVLSSSAAVVFANGRDDLVTEMNRLIASRSSFEDKMRSPVSIAASIKTAILGQSLSVIYSGGQLVLPRGKRITLVNFEGDVDICIICQI